MARKTDIVREAVKAGEWKKALRIAKGFKINITEQQRKDMTLAYECMIYPDFYAQLGRDVAEAVAKGIEVVSCLYGATQP